jgi:hypothetical protein
MLARMPGEDGVSALSGIQAATLFRRYFFNSEKQFIEMRNWRYQ